MRSRTSSEYQITNLVNCITGSIKHTKATFLCFFVEFQLGMSQDQLQMSVFKLLFLE